MTLEEAKDYLEHGSEKSALISILVKCAELNDPIVRMGALKTLEDIGELKTKCGTQKHN